MFRLFNFRKPTTVLALACLVATSAWSADPLTDALQSTQAPYRLALYKTNMGSPAEAQQAVEAAQSAWTRFAAEHGAAPSAPYDRDAQFAASVQAVAKVYAHAAAQAKAGDAKSAHTTLEEVREVTADLRRRNNIIVFSDHMNAYHAQMERVMTEGPDLIKQEQGWLKLSAQAGALSYLTEQLRLEAPKTLQSNPDFGKLLQAVEESVQAVRGTILKQDEPAARAAIGKLKGPYSKLFAHFG